MKKKINLEFIIVSTTIIAITVIKICEWLIQ